MLQYLSSTGPQTIAKTALSGNARTVWVFVFMPELFVRIHVSLVPIYAQTVRAFSDREVSCYLHCCT